VLAVFFFLCVCDAAAAQLLSQHFILPFFPAGTDDGPSQKKKYYYKITVANSTDPLTYTRFIDRVG
jgi:hypothetical protein